MYYMIVVYVLRSTRNENKTTAVEDRRFSETLPEQGYFVGT